MPAVKFICSWPDCCSTFTQNKSLQRHIRTVHKKECTHVCILPNCGASFRSAYDLKRHCLSVHTKERNFKCTQCPKAFITSEVLRKHERSIHGIIITTSNSTIRIEKPSYECAECGVRCVRKDVLTRHISRRHGDKEYFECHTCGCRYSCKSYLRKHIFSRHSEEIHRKPAKNILCCMICEKWFQYRYQIEKHYQEFHQIDLNTEKNCSWPGCFSVFTHNKSLQRHIKTVHMKERTHKCTRPNCDASFGSACDLKRHCLGVHIKGRNFKCSQCPKAFNTSSTLRVHERYRHGIVITSSDDTAQIEKPYECAECGHHFVRKGDLVRHITRKHGEKEYFECSTCGCRYNSKVYLQKHIISRSCEQVHHMSQRNRLLCCILCKTSFQYRYQIENHYQDFHDIALNTEKLKFPTTQDFLNWKQNMEDSTKTRFNLRRRTKWKLTYTCHRSGPVRVKSCDRKRANILRGSKKLDGMCPASITLFLNKKDSSCIATFIQTHVGHLSNDKTELKYCFLRRKDREKLAEMIAAGIPKRQILDEQLEACADLLYDFVNTDFARSDLLTNKDLCNVENAYNLKSHENFILSNESDDAEKIEEFVNKHEKFVLLYKRQGQRLQNEYEDIGLLDEDTILIFMCPTQRKILEKHLDIMCIHGTHENNPYDYYLHTLLVLDYDGEGFPAAFMLSNRNEEVLIEVFARCLKINVGIIIPNVMMTDMSEAYFEGWINEMGSPKLVLQCMWHIWQAWRKHLPKTNKNEPDNEKNILRANLKSELYSLSVETCIETFHQKLEKFLTPCDDSKINSFLEYFSREYCENEKYEQWAYSYRLNAGVNTNTHFESFHHTLKYVHGCVRSIKDFYSGLQLILRFVTQRIILMLNKTMLGKVTPRLTALKKAHNEFDEFQKNHKIIVTEVSQDEWRVQSFKETKNLCVEMYTIRKIRQTCPAEEDPDIGACYLMCNECDDCAHKYSCSCLESAKQSHMCKHIHAVLSYENIEIIYDYDDSSLISTNQDIEQLIVDENFVAEQSIKEEYSSVETESTEEDIKDAYEKGNDISRRRIMERLQMLAQSIEHCSEEDISAIKKHLGHLEAVFDVKI